MDKFLTVSEAAKILGVSASTLRRWDREGTLVPDRTMGNQRRYLLSSLRPDKIDFASLEKSKSKKTLAYARVSSHDQRKDLETQKTVLDIYCAEKGWDFEIISDLGSGMNYKKKGLRRLIENIISGDIERLVLTHKDRLLRFGAELIFSICEINEIEVVIINSREDASFEEDLAKDVLEIITVFSARLYGSRSNKNKKIIEGMTKVVLDAD